MTKIVQVLRPHGGEEGYAVAFDVDEDGFICARVKVVAENVTNTTDAPSIAVVGAVYQQFADIPEANNPPDPDVFEDHASPGSSEAGNIWLIPDIYYAEEGRNYVAVWVKWDDNPDHNDRRVEVFVATQKTTNETECTASDSPPPPPPPPPRPVTGGGKGKKGKKPKPAPAKKTKKVKTAAKKKAKPTRGRRR